LAAGVGWSVHAAIDWDWEMPALTLWLFALGGAALARSPRTDNPRAPRWAGAGMRVALVAACAVAAILPVRVALSEARLDASVDALYAGDCVKARTAARQSLDRLGHRPQPYQVVAFCDLRDGRPRQAARAMSSAVERDPQNWELQLGLAVARSAAGLDPRRAARTALALNPREPVVAEQGARLASARRGQWRRLGRNGTLTLPAVPLEPAAVGQTAAAP
jgi:hypothetical protein